MSIVHPPQCHAPVSLACAQRGCPACLDALIRHHEGLIHAVLQQTQRGPVPYDHLVQEGRLALWRAVAGFDPRRGTAFSTYAWIAIQRRLWRTVAQASRPQRPLEPPSPPAPLEAVLFQVWRSQVRPPLHQALNRLPAELRTILSAHYGLDGADPCSLAALARKRGLSRERMRQLRNEALVLLRLPALAAPLHQVCGHNTRQAQARLQALNQAWIRKRRTSRRRA